MAIIELQTPVKEKEIQSLKINDHLYLNGTIITARDMAHQRALNCFKEGKALPFSFKDLAIYHCGPIIEKKNDGWSVLAACPTTSNRMESMEP